MCIISNNPNNKLTFQEYQAIYSEITQKNEHLTKHYTKAFKLNKTHISHLKQLIDDILRQYNVISINTNISVYQSDNVKKHYSSIENFLTIDTTAKATEQIVIEYDLLIQVPNIEKKQSYKIVIKILSDVIAFSDAMNKLPIELLDMIEKNNIEIKIDYIDYTIAKSIINTFDEWVTDISDKNNKFLSFIENQKKSFAFAIKNLIIFFSFMIVYTFIPKYISIANTDMQLFTKFIIVSIGLIYLSNKIASVFSIFIRTSLSFLQNFSSIELTPEDKKNIDIYESKKKSKVILFFITILLTLIYGVISSLIANQIQEKYINDSSKQAITKTE
ncbi:hypothetical protein [Aliarcobacter butzleri]|uniref:hypothetical protein n=1 Tax=Aliarcobacter butzleri TaxID=28197 RepID=UPI00344E065C